MEGTVNAEQVTFLLVEDDDIDAEAVVRGFRKGRIANPVRRARNGAEALAVLRGVDSSTGPLPRPYIVLLDLNMPKMNGIEFLAEVRQDDDLRDSVVFVLTTSNADRDRADAYNQNIAGYIVKSNAGEDFTKVVSLLDRFWRTVVLPS